MTGSFTHIIKYHIYCIVYAYLEFDALYPWLHLEGGGDQQEHVSCAVKIGFNISQPKL